MSHPFTTLALRRALFEALAQVGYVEMTPIQAMALPILLAGADVIGQASTGSGKTAAFGLGLLQGIDDASFATQALVLCPTRELSDQVAEELRRLAQRMPNTRVVSVCGGRPKRDQVKALAGPSQVVVGTPGRIGDHLRQGSLDVTQLRVLVLDEADRMLDLGFVDQVRAIVDALPASRQTALFSATYPAEIAQLSAAVQRDPTFVEVASRVEPELLRQQVVRCEPPQRQALIADLLAHHAARGALVFCETRDDCIALAAFLTARGAVALVLHGQLDQRARDDVLVQLANGSASVLVATNVAARGLDIPALPLVIVAELSPDPESHLHRIGRTGRAGEAGLAVSIVATEAERGRLARIEHFLDQRLQLVPSPPPAHDLGVLVPPNRTLLLLSGRKDKLRKGDVLGALVQDGGIPAEAIGRIDLTDRSCAVAIARAFAPAALAWVQSGRIKNRRVRATLLGGRPPKEPPAPWPDRQEPEAKNPP